MPRAAPRAVQRRPGWPRREGMRILLPPRRPRRLGAGVSPRPPARPQPAASTPRLARTGPPRPAQRRSARRETRSAPEAPPRGPARPMLRRRAAWRRAAVRRRMRAPSWDRVRRQAGGASATSHKCGGVVLKRASANICFVTRWDQATLESRRERTDCPCQRTDCPGRPAFQGAWSPG